MTSSNRISCRVRTIFPLHFTRFFGVSVVCYCVCKVCHRLFIPAGQKKERKLVICHKITTASFPDQIFIKHSIWLTSSLLLFLLLLDHIVLQIMALDLLKSVAAAGSSAVITVTGIHPIDVVKTRLQVSGDGTNGARNYKALGIGGTVRVIASEEGPTAFWKGIGAAWLREASYTSLRLGLYGPIKHAMHLKPDSHFVLKFSAGSLAGAIGSIVGNPFDVLKTRMMTAEGSKPPTMAEAGASLMKAQGIAGFYRGIEANVMRAMVLNGTKMACYDTIKGEIVKSGLIPKGT